jgi:ubiquinone/menaquinone biosynthesis C-methylase UbiE
MSEIGREQNHIRDFYEGLYNCPIFSEHHRICCNVGYHPISLKNAPSDTELYLREVNGNDQFQLQLYEELFQSMRSSLKNEYKFKIVDVGCGPGGGVCKIQSMFPTSEVIGIDISSQAIARCKENFAKMERPFTQIGSNKPRFYQYPVANMSGIASASIDAVSAIQTLQEVEDLEQGLNEIDRILKPGAFLFVADFIPQDLSKDRIQNDLLNKKQANFEVLSEHTVTFNASVATKMDSSHMEKLISKFIPVNFQSELSAFFFVQGTQLYEQLRLGKMGYRFVILRKTSEKPKDNEYRQLDEEEEHVYSSDDDIIDDDMPNFYPYKEIFPQLEVLKEKYDIIREEMQQVQSRTSWPFWPERHYASESSEWRVFPLCYTFPAHDASKTVWVDPTCNLCPKTAEILRNISGIRTALFSKLGPKTTLGAHRGWADLSNHILRCHIGLIVPTLSNGKPCCAMVVGGDTCYHKEKEILVFDDSKLHYAYNEHDEATRIVLIVDLYRPDHIPRGKAKGGHTEELDEFIDSFGKQALGQ